MPPSWLLPRMCSPDYFLLKIFACPVERFLFRMLVVFHSGHYVFQFLSYLNETQHWSMCVESCHDLEHVQANREYFGLETTNAVFSCMEIPALERDDGCHQVGFRPGWSRCDVVHNVWCVHSDVLMTSPSIFDLDVCDSWFWRVR